MRTQYKIGQWCYLQLLPQCEIFAFMEFYAVKMEQLGCPETSVKTTNLHYIISQKSEDNALIKSDKCDDEDDDDVWKLVRK